MNEVFTDRADWAAAHSAAAGYPGWLEAEPATAVLAARVVWEFQARAREPALEVFLVGALRVRLVEELGVHPRRLNLVHPCRHGRRKCFVIHERGCAASEE